MNGREVPRLTPEEERQFWANEVPPHTFRNRWCPISSARGAVTSAFFFCPDCGDLGTLAGHNIAADGTVTPSVLLSNCGFHESGIKLLGWKP